MPKRDDIRTILIIGSGPIVIGQACEFDYSGTQACKALREEGYQIVLVNSNPATIMTDPQIADRTYIEPITPEAVAKVIQAEHGGPFQIDALLPTLGGQTALNTACNLDDSGVLARYGIEMIGAKRAAIYRAEDRREFGEVVRSVGLRCPRSGIAHSMEDAWAVLEDVKLPAIIRPAFTLGGSGGGIAYNREEFEEICRRGLDASMTRQILIDQSLIGWKEYELEVMRDRDDNVVIVCPIENFDPMGVHTGDSITVAPAQTLTDKEYQRLRDGSVAIIRAVGVETGGSNIQFAVNPDDGEVVVIEMNPRVSRSSALASKATGFPIAKIAAKLAVGYTLWELDNDITGKTVACFEPTIDYVVTKIPRWTFEKFPEADETLTTQMKSVGEAMSIGRTFKESFQKGIRSMEVKRFGLGLDNQDKWLAGARLTRRWLREYHGDELELLAAPCGSTLRAAAMAMDGPDAAHRHGLKLDARQAATLKGLHETVVAMLEQQRDQTPDKLGAADGVEWPVKADKLRRKLNVPCQGRLYYIRYAFKLGWSIEEVHEATNIDPWFLDQIRQLVDFEQVLVGVETLDELSPAVLRQAKQMGYSDPQLANLYLGSISPKTIMQVRSARQRHGITPVYKLVDTCAAEFEAATPYYYSTYESPITRVTASEADRVESSSPVCYAAEMPAVTQAIDDEIRVTDRKKIVILGGGPNRIGQGIEFDYCCVQAAFAADELGFESVMINSNPETVSTDYDTSDLLFFEPLTLEDVLNICERLNGAPLGERGHLHGVIVQFGGQTPLNLAHGLQQAGVPIIGTSVDSIDLAESRERFSALIRKLGIQQPRNGIAYNPDQAIEIANQIGYPVLVRPSFVLGGRAMETVFDDQQLRHYIKIAMGASDLPDQPILIDQFLSEAIECDVDVVADFGGREGRDCRALVAGVMEHIEEAGIHSGDSACAIPPFSLPPAVVERLKQQSRMLAEALRVRGLMNVQWAIRRPQKEGGEHEIFVLEVNPRASRTVPFVSKATGVSWARIAAKVMAGRQLAELGVTEEPTPRHTSVKESVFPFNKFPGVDVILGPEMRSTGEVMGIDADFAVAFAKSQMAAGTILPTQGQVFISVRDGDKPAMVEIARQMASMGFELLATEGTGRFLAERGISTTPIRKVNEGRPNALDAMKNGELALMLITPTRKGIASDEGRLRAAAVRFNVPIVTTVTGARAVVRAIAALRRGDWSVRALQEYFPQAVGVEASLTS